jgi:HEAT repeat protein
LGKLGDPQALPRLKKMHKSRYSVVSAAAQRAIEQINAQSAHGRQP